MGNKILIWRSVTKGNELDIFNQTDYSTFYEDITNKFGKSCPNWGNKLWFQGLVSEIDDGSNQIVFRTNESIDEINNNFDMIIYPMANFFGIEYCSDTSALVSVFSKIKIPTYIIACGVQASNYDQLDWIIKEIGEEAKKFISAIYNTGGEIALRGEFSKEFFDRLGFSSAVVTGCPSLYQFGKDFQLESNKVKKDEVFPVFNGNIHLYRDAIKYYKNSSYIDQDSYFLPLFDSKYFDNNGFGFKYGFYRMYGVISSELLSQNRIKLIADMNDWYHYLKNGKFNFALGSRIHGTIMSILAGVPAMLLAIDSRTKEMAEFFDIPYIDVSSKSNFNENDLYDFYLQTDYTKFNQTFGDKFSKYQSFLVKNKIVSEVNENNKFFNENTAKNDFDKYVVNTDKFSDFTKELKSNMLLFKIRETLSKIKSK